MVFCSGSPRILRHPLITSPIWPWNYGRASFKAYRASNFGKTTDFLYLMAIEKMGDSQRKEYQDAVVLAFQLKEPHSVHFLWSAAISFHLGTQSLHVLHVESRPSKRESVLSTKKLTYKFMSKVGIQISGPDAQIITH